MNTVYRITVRGRRLESRDLRKLLAQAVAEKRIMDQRLRLFASVRNEHASAPVIGPCSCLVARAMPGS
jgi:hypothetical protein